MKTLILTRAELYEKIWETPMRMLSKEFGISDRALAKRCDKHKIPKPGVGYWAKISHGKNVKKIPLPSIEHNYLDSILFYPEKMNKKKNKEIIAKPLENDSRVIKAKKFRFPQKIAKYHELLQLYRKGCKKSSVDRYGTLIPDCSCKSTISLKVTQPSYQRACQFMQALINLFGQFGWELKTRQLSNSYKHESLFLLETEELRFKLREKTKRIKHELTIQEKADKKAGRYCYAAKYDYVGTGGLLLIVEEWGYSDLNLSWSDKANLPLETQLPEITTGFILAMEYSKASKIEKEKQQRAAKIQQQKELELQRVRDIETKRREYLFEVAQALDKSKQLQSLIQSIKESKFESEELSNWLNWANEY